MSDHDDRPVAELLRSFAKFRSQEAFTALTARFSGLVYHTALRRTGSEALAADVTQEVFIALAKQAPSLRADDRLGAWLHRRALYAASDLLRSEARRRKREAAAAAMNAAESASATSGAGAASWQDAVPELDRALNALKPADRRSVVLRYLEGRNLAEVGEAEGVTKEAAQKRVSRALEKLRSILTRRGAGISLAVLVQGLSGESAKAAPAGLVSQVSSAGLAAATAQSGLALWFIRWRSALGSGLAGAAGAAAIWALPLAMQFRAIAALEQSRPAAAPRITAAVSLPAQNQTAAASYEGMRLEELVAELAALLETDVSSMDALRLQAMREAIAPGDAHAALVMLEEKLSPRARARSESHGAAIRTSLLRDWARSEPLAALENLVSRFDPVQPLELPADGEWLAGDWFDTAESCFLSYAQKDKAAGKQWYFAALRSGRLDYQRGGEFSLLNSINGGLDLVFYEKEPHLVIDASIESINRTGSQFASGSLLSRDWDAANVEYKLEAAKKVTDPTIQAHFNSMLEAQRLGQWIDKDLPRARTWLMAQPENVQKDHFQQTIFPRYEAHALDKQGADWTPHIEWALQARPGDCTEDKLPGLVAHWLHHDAERASAWLCAHTTSAKAAKAGFLKSVTLLDERADDKARTSDAKSEKRWDNFIRRTLKAALTLAAEWQRRDPEGAAAGADEALLRLKERPSLRDPVLKALRP